MKARTALIAAAVAAVLAGAWIWQRHGRLHPAAVRVPVAGGDAGGLPQAQPADEHLDAAALARAAQDPAAAGLQAFIVMRHGHVVFARYAHGVDADTLIDSGPFARALLGLLTGVAQQQGVLPATALRPASIPRACARRSSRARTRITPTYLSQRIWSRLNAATAWIVLPAAGAVVPADCCVQARVQDWMRVGGPAGQRRQLRGHAGAAPGWVAHMRQPISADGREGFGVELPGRAPGTRGYQATDLFLLRGPARWRVWIMPSLQLAVLFGAAGADHGWDEARLPNLVVGALTERAAPPTGQSLLQQLVPGH